MKRQLLTMALLVCGLCFAAEYKVTVQTNGTQENIARVVDGDTQDSSIWEGVGPQTLTFTFAPAQDIAAVRLHPGNRVYYPNPSTDGAPKRVRISRQLAGKAVGEPQEFTMARIPPLGNESVAELTLATAGLCDQLTMELLESHDGGFRLHSPDKSVVPPEGRGYSIREVQFLTADDFAAMRKGLGTLKSRAAALVETYDLFCRTNGILENALAQTYARRFEVIRDMAEGRKACDEATLEKEITWLSGQVMPYIGATLGQSDNASSAVVVSLKAQSTVPGEIIAFPLNFAMLEQASAKKLSRYDVAVYARTSAGTRKLNTKLEHINPDRARLSWANVAGAASYSIELCEAADGEQPLPDKLVGCGDHLMMDCFITGAMPGNFWSVRGANVFGDAQPAIVAGRWTDYIHVYRNRGTAQKFAFQEAEHYMVRDPYDNLVGVSAHHGLAFSVAEPVDYDHDGKMDIFVTNFYNNQPMFLHNVGEKPGMLEFASPVSVASLPRGWRYAYGDLDGDGIADAIGARAVKDGVIETRLLKGLGIGEKGEARFAEGKPLDVTFPNSTCMSRGNSAYTIAISLDDLNGDGRLDLSMVSAPAVYICHNDGSNDVCHFTEPKRLMKADGKPFETTYYYPNLGWLDLNGDGLKDFFRRVINDASYAVDGTPTVEAKPTYMGWLTQQQPLPYGGLGGFQILDFDGDGAMEVCMQGYSKMVLSVAKYRDGLFQEPVLYNLGNPNMQGYGCPDTTEYGNYYSQICMDDFDGDGKPDVLLNNEHNWRFGYYSLFRNLGDGKFAPEERVVPKAMDYLKTIDSPTGKALAVNSETILDYLAVDTAKLFDGKGGAIEFDFAANNAKLKSPARALFSSTYWNRNRHNANQLWEVYYNRKTMAEFFEATHGFALVQLADGKLTLQVDDKTATTEAAVALPANEWHRFRVEWASGTTRALMDGKEVLAVNAMPKPAEKLHIGSQAWMAVQYAREYPSRRSAHPVDFACPAEGFFDSFRTFNAQGEATLNLDFNDAIGMGELPRRAALLYRCAPDVIQYNGKPALLAHFNDPYRNREGRKMDEPVAQLHIVPFQRTPGQAPAFETPIPLFMTDGKPFYAHSRTVVTAYDWNKDGAMDIILSTENYQNDFNVGVELFLNDGNWRFTRTKNAEIVRLNELLTAHHDVKLVLCDLFGSGEDDFFVWTDPGLRAYRRAYLRQQEVPVKVESIVIK